MTFHWMTLRQIVKQHFVDACWTTLWRHDTWLNAPTMLCTKIRDLPWKLNCLQPITFLFKTSSAYVGLFSVHCSSSMMEWELQYTAQCQSNVSLIKCCVNTTLHQRPQNDVWICHSVTLITRRNTTPKQQAQHKNNEQYLTHFAPDCSSLPAPYWHPSLCKQQRDTCKTCSLVSANVLLYATSGDVLCSKFGGVWEMLWIFKVARWTHNWCTKINKSPTVSNDIGQGSYRKILSKFTTFSQSFATWRGKATWRYATLPHIW